MHEILIIIILNKIGYQYFNHSRVRNSSATEGLTLPSRKNKRQNFSVVHGDREVARAAKREGNHAGEKCRHNTCSVQL